MNKKIVPAARNALFLGYVRQFLSVSVVHILRTGPTGVFSIDILIAQTEKVNPEQPLKKTGH